MKKRLLLVGILALLAFSNTFGQVTLPRESTRQEVIQFVGDSKITIIYHRPNVKGREGKVYGCGTENVIQRGNNTGPCLVPNGQVWRAGANENTTIEFSTDVAVNGQPLPAGKYGFFVIPSEKEWIAIFNKVNNEWGAFTYKEDQDALRVKMMPVDLSSSQESLAYNFENVVGNSANIVLSWEKKALPLTVNVGDINLRVLNQIREAIKTRNADDARALNQGAGFVLSNKMKASYSDALGWLDESIKIKETFGNLNSKSRLLAEMGKKADAIATAEKAIELGRSSTPPANANQIAGLENELKKWKENK